MERPRTRRLVQLTVPAVALSHVSVVSKTSASSYTGRLRGVHGWHSLLFPFLPHHLHLRPRRLLVRSLKKNLRHLPSHLSLSFYTGHVYRSAFVLMCSYCGYHSYDDCRQKKQHTSLERPMRDRARHYEKNRKENPRVHVSCRHPPPPANLPCNCDDLLQVHMPPRHFFLSNSPQAGAEVRCGAEEMQSKGRHGRIMMKRKKFLRVMKKRKTRQKYLERHKEQTCACQGCSMLNR